MTKEGPYATTPKGEHLWIFEFLSKNSICVMNGIRIISGADIEDATHKFLDVSSSLVTFKCVGRLREKYEFAMFR